MMMWPSFVAWDHPRMCGEHTPDACSSRSMSGSSPHVRGALKTFITPDYFCGIIPACAGSTIICFRTISILRDHPRMCGEHDIIGRADFRRMGSSPHVRGALADAQIIPVLAGIIPACAGSTQGPTTTVSATRDHPRMCGEHASVVVIPKAVVGSSPHVRGALPSITHFLRSFGIIPACAGSTLLNHDIDRDLGDHPRMCGEHYKYVVLKKDGKGSSPHVRGALSFGHTERNGSGIIPACAGSTCPPAWRTHCIRDHPRMCGEHVALMLWPGQP